MISKGPCGWRVRTWFSLVDILTHSGLNFFATYVCFFTVTELQIFRTFILFKKVSDDC